MNMETDKALSHEGKKAQLDTMDYITYKRVTFSGTDNYFKDGSSHAEPVFQVLQ